MCVVTPLVVLGHSVLFDGNHIKTHTKTVSVTATRPVRRIFVAFLGVCLLAPVGNGEVCHEQVPHTPLINY